MEHYERLETEISELPSSYYLNTALTLSIEPLKLALAVEAKAWKTAYGHSLNHTYQSSMENIVKFINEYTKKLGRPIKVCGVWRTDNCVGPSELKLWPFKIYKICSKFSQ